MRHRIFIAINLPEKLKNKLSEYRNIWPDLPARWTKKDNLHVTLVFIGSVKEEEIAEICEKTEAVVTQSSSFSVHLNNVCYAPPKKIPPRMVWVKGEVSHRLTKLKLGLEEALISSSLKNHFEPDKRAFNPHITLARIRAMDFRNLDIEERPGISEKVSFSFNVNSVEVMESKLKRTGAEYIILNSYNLIKRL